MPALLAEPVAGVPVFFSLLIASQLSLSCSLCLSLVLTLTYTANMMEEVSISVAYNAHIINQMSEEEILASLVAESLPKQPVSSASCHTAMGEIAIVSIRNTESYTV